MGIFIKFIMDQYAYSQARESIMSHLVVTPGDITTAKDPASFMQECVKKNN